MTQTGSSNAIVNLMLGWLKGLASWVLRLFNLSAGFSPLKFLANHWLQLLVLLLVIGVAADLLIWLIRWRPHWVWFRKKRVIINDKNFFAGENEFDEEEDWDLPAEYMRREREERSRRNWHDNDFVVAGAASRRREERAREAERRRRERAAREEEMRLAAATEIADDVFTDGQFNVNAKQKFSDRYEDEVFSVSNLPRPERGERARKLRESRPERRQERGGSAAPARGRRPEGERSAPRGNRPAPRVAREGGDRGAQKRRRAEGGRR